MQTDSCIYIYCIINSSEKIALTVDGMQVYSIPYRDISMIAGSFRKEDGIGRRINEYALLHEGIVEKMMKRFTVLPMRLLTLFPSEDKVLAALEKHYDVFTENLERLFLKSEFGLKVLWLSEKIKENISNSIVSGSNIGEAVSGAKYFMKKKYEKYKIEEMFSADAKICIEYIDKFFAEVAAEKKLLKLQTEKLLLNASYLVCQNRHDDFRRAFEKLKKAFPGFCYQLSGPGRHITLLS